jgi:hypothetical protein
MTLRRFALILTGAVIGMVPAAAVAVEFPYPTVEFAADMTMRIKPANGEQPHLISGTLNSTRNSERREIENFGQKTIIIKRRDKNETWLLMPAVKSYQVTRGDKQRDDPERMIRSGELKLTKQGTEIVNGVSAVKYRVSSEGSQKGKFSGYTWLTLENIPVRFEGNARDGNRAYDIRIDYHRIRIGRQDRQLFEIPPGYRRIPDNGPVILPPQSEQMPKGVNEEILERYHKQMQEIMKQRPNQ